MSSALHYGPWTSRSIVKPAKPVVRHKAAPGYGPFYDPGLGSLPASSAESGLARILAALTDKNQGSYAARAAKSVHASIDPVLAEINRMFAGRAKAGQDAIQGITTAEQGALRQSAGDVGRAYDEASSSTSASNAALAKFLGGEGDKASGDLAATLKAAGQDTGVAQNVANTGASSAGMTAAIGNANLDQTLGDKGNAVGYANTLPGIAGLAGIQRSGDLQTQIASDLADQTGQVTSAVPGMVQDLISSYMASGADAGKTRAGLISDYINNIRSGNLNAAVTRGGLFGDQQKTLAGASAAADRANLSLASLNERIAHDRAIEQNQAASVEERRQAAADRLAAQQLANEKKAAKDHKTAVNNRGTASTSFLGQIDALAAAGLNPKPVTKTVTNKVTGESKKVKGPGTPKTYNEAVAQALALPAVKMLKARFNYTDAEIRQMVEDELFSHGYPQASGAYGTGARGNRPG